MVIEKCDGFFGVRGDSLYGMTYSLLVEFCVICFGGRFATCM